MKVSEPLIEVKQSFQQPIEKVWKALTDVNEMRQWFFENISAFEPTVGFKTQFTVESEDRKFPHLWEITEVIPFKKIVYNWKYEGYKGNSFVTFQLSEVDNQTQLCLTTKVTEDFPDTIPEFKRDSCIAGWNYFIKTSLVNFFNN
ncbi:SRPBCC family protein [Psychroserpens jangbogonensis]|uniref:SRPBCC family protein n=1 Tax=Psychroserpens jangbogonensis TaxID=1484460 RepID=UPI00053EAA0D|nr:SRPBCC domain-containing protein [Psychroserpens jangbogonensis]